MWRLALLIWLGLCGNAWAQAQIYIYTPLGYQQISSMSAATFLTLPSAPPPSGPAKIAEICAEAQGVRYRDDGTAPTASIGIPVAAGTCFQYSGNLVCYPIHSANVGSDTRCCILPLDFSLYFFALRR